MNVAGWRTQFAAGQGSFHAGAVCAGGRSVRYIYDCGSQPRYAADLDREIDEALLRLNSTVDVLYISHFHEDHISGVRQLLDRAAVKRVVLPLTPAVDRLMAFAFALGAPDDSGLPEWYIDAVTAPRTFFETFGAEVTEVVPGDGSIPLEFPIGQGDDFGASFSPPRPGQRDSLESTAQLADRSQPIWLWVPWTTTRADAAQDSFLAALGSSLGRSQEEVRQIVEDPVALKALGMDRSGALRRAYNVGVNGRDLNFTSMCLYSGLPPIHSARQQGVSWRSKQIGRFENVAPTLHVHRSEVGWLGAGDAELSTRIRAAEFNQYFAPVRPGVGTFVLPHHGSDRNSCDDLLTAFNTGATFVANADHYLNWQHPGPSTTRSALGRGHLAWVRRDPTTRWTEYFTVDT